MAERKERNEILRVLSLCVAWYFISSSNNVVGKTLLNEFPYPMTVTMVQLVSIAVYSSPVLRWMGVRRRADISWSYYKRIIIPLAFGKFISSVFSHVSIWRVPVSYAHTVKATMPLFTVVLCRVIFGEKQTSKVYLSLVPIIVGVAIATITEISFDMIGLIAALMATCGFSLQNMFSKKVMTDTGIHHLRLLHLLGVLALIMFLPVWILTDGYSIIKDETLHLRRNPGETFILLLVDGVLNWLQNFVAFTILNYVTPLTYAVANATKRISVITISLILLKNPITFSNVVGMFMAIIGVLGYNKAKYDANKSRKRMAVVPLTQVMTNKHMADQTGTKRTGRNFPLYELTPNGHPLQLPPVHPAYAFSHLASGGLGPYPRTENIVTGISSEANSSHQINQTVNGYVHNGIENGIIPNGHSVHTTRSYGRVDSV